MASESQSSGNQMQEKRQLSNGNNLYEKINNLSQRRLGRPNPAQIYKSDSLQIVTLIYCLFGGPG